MAGKPGPSLPMERSARLRYRSIENGELDLGFLGSLLFAGGPIGLHLFRLRLASLIAQRGTAATLAGFLGGLGGLGFGGARRRAPALQEPDSLLKPVSLSDEHFDG